MAIGGSGRRALGVGVQLGVAVAGVLLLAGAAAVALVNHHMRRQALAEAEAKARLLLERNLATHAYFAHELKPRLFELTDPVRPSRTFEPAWMSSTYAVRRMHEELPSFGGRGVYYKECAVNARFPGNEADPFERGFLAELNRDPGLTARSGIRTLDGEPYFYTLRRGETMEETCLRCHSTPDVAPAGLVDRYGPERSFGRRAGEVVSAVSVRVPLAAAYANANRLSLQLSLWLVALLGLVYLGLLRVNQRLVTRPLSRVRGMALGIAAEDDRLGETIRVAAGREIAELADAFNTLSLRLREHVDGLEAAVSSRTADLEEANARLRSEVQERRRAEEEKAGVIVELQGALAQVRTLRGLVPICAWCKKIRDDQGFWNQLEAYLREHSEAEFSHGICPECLAGLKAGGPAEGAGKDRG